MYDNDFEKENLIKNEKVEGIIGYLNKDKE